MKTIKFENPEVVTFNPTYISKVELISGEYDTKKWCVKLTFSNEKIYVTPLTTKEEAETTYEYVIACIESI